MFGEGASSRGKQLEAAILGCSALIQLRCPCLYQQWTIRRDSGESHPQCPLGSPELPSSCQNPWAAWVGMVVVCVWLARKERLRSVTHIWGFWNTNMSLTLHPCLVLHSQVQTHGYGEGGKGTHSPIPQIAESPRLGRGVTGDAASPGSFQGTNLSLCFLRSNNVNEAWERK